MTPCGVGLLRLLVLPVLAVSVSIGAVMPSAPFDAWSPPPMSVEHGARPVDAPHAASGERGVLLRGPARLTTITIRLGLARAALTVIDPASRRLAAPASPVAPEAARRLLAVPGWAVTGWSGAPSGPDRAPPSLPTT